METANGALSGIAMEVTQATIVESVGTISVVITLEGIVLLTNVAACDASHTRAGVRMVTIMALIERTPFRLWKIGTAWNL